MEEDKVRDPLKESDASSLRFCVLREEKISKNGKLMNLKIIESLYK